MRALIILLLLPCYLFAEMLLPIGQPDMQPDMQSGTQSEAALEMPLEEQLLLAYAAYSEGESAPSHLVAEGCFNRALELYHSLAPRYSSAPLYQNIANCYFQLGEYTYAILYYRRALLLAPRDRTLKELVAITREKLKVEAPPRGTTLLELLTLSRLISERESLFVVAACATLLAIVGSLALWKGSRRLYHGAIVIAGFSLYMLVTLLLNQSFADREAVLIRAAMLRCDAGFTYAPSIDKPLPGGSDVIIKSCSRDGQWLHIETLSGELGFIPADAARRL